LLQGPRNGIRERLDRFVHRTRKAIGQVLRQKRDVLTPLTQ